MAIIGQISTKIQTEVVTQEHNQEDQGHYYRKENNFKQASILRTLTPVPIFDPLPRRREKTTAALTDKGHLNQAKMCLHEATVLRQISRGSNTRTALTESNENNEFIFGRRKRYYTKVQIE
jgi:hypothetical protein